MHVRCRKECSGWSCIVQPDRNVRSSGAWGQTGGGGTTSRTSATSFACADSADAAAALTPNRRSCSRSRCSSVPSPLVPSRPPQKTSLIYRLYVRVRAATTPPDKGFVSACQHFVQRATDQEQDGARIRDSSLSVTWLTCDMLISTPDSSRVPGSRV